MKNRAIELELTVKAMELARLYRKFNPRGNYLNISFLEIEENKGRIHINNAYYDRDHNHPVDVIRDFDL